jgi:hypothetical protein
MFISCFIVEILFFKFLSCLEDKLCGLFKGAEYSGKYNVQQKLYLILLSSFLIVSELLFWNVIWLNVKN